MFPPFYGNTVNQSDQPQGNQMRRPDQGFRQDAARQQQLQNPYSTVNINSPMPGQQFDTRFLGNVNPVMNPNAGLPYGMVSGSYGDTLKAVPISYDRAVMNYPIQMQMMGIQPGAYGGVNPYYPYFGYRQGIPGVPMERGILPGYRNDYSLQPPQDKLQQPNQSVTTSSKQQSSTTIPVKQEGIPDIKTDNYQPVSQPAASKPNDSIPDAPSTVQIKDESTQTNPQKDSGDISDDMHLANMLLQIKGKTKESLTPTSLPPQVNELAMNQLPPNRGFSQSTPALPKTEDKRAHLDVPYDMAYNMMCQYPIQQIPYVTGTKQLYTQQYPLPQARFQAYPFQPAQALPTQLPTQPTQSSQSAQSTQPATTHPPIPSPAPLHKLPCSLPVGDYYVFCTVCRHGTPISITNPIPDVFKCANCGFSCHLDKHLLSYYSFNIPTEKTENVNLVEAVQVKSEVIEPMTVKNEPVDVAVKTEGTHSSELYHLPEQSNQPQESKEHQQSEQPEQPKEHQQSEQPEQPEEHQQSDQPEQPEQPDQPEEHQQSEQETGVEAGVLQEPVCKEEVQTVQNDQNDQIPVAVAVAVMNTPSVMNTSLSIDSIVLSSLEKELSYEELFGFASRNTYSIEEGVEQNLSKETIESLKTQCVNASKEWWIGKFIKMEIPESQLIEDDLLTKEKVEGDAEKKMIVGEVIGMSEIGFVIRIAESKGNKTINVANMVSGNNKCWILLKEGYLNLNVC